MSDLFREPDHATPLTAEEKLGLLPAYIAYRSELNEAEQENIARAQAWAISRKRDLLSEIFIRELHRRMLGDVWKWAGRFRKSERNVGIRFYEIPTALRQLLDDSKAQIDYKTYPADEIAVRFHHRLVQIHLFPNGNGRHSRLIADLLAIRLGREQFSWGRERKGCGAHRQKSQELARAALRFARFIKRVCVIRAKRDGSISPPSKLPTTTI